LSAGVTIRRADREDAETLLSLITALAHYEKLDPPDDGARQRLIQDGFGERPRYEAWLAESDGQPVGYAILFETYSTFLAQPTLYLEDLFLLPDYRGKGLGEALFLRVSQVALERGCGRMEWVCLDWNQAGLRFYEKLGATHMREWLTFRLVAEEIAALGEQQDQPV
jgi:GNAT superfamily N-acetyltransferase